MTAEEPDAARQETSKDGKEKTSKDVLLAFATTSRAYDSDVIDVIERDLRNLFGRKSGAYRRGSPLDLFITAAVRHAHLVSAEAKLAALENLPLPCNIDSVALTTRTIRRHFAASGNPAVKGSAQLDRLNAAIKRAFRTNPLHDRQDASKATPG